jgi:hypothetical protein
MSSGKAMHSKKTANYLGPGVELLNESAWNARSRFNQKEKKKTNPSLAVGMTDLFMCPPTLEKTPQHTHLTFIP